MTDLGTMLMEQAEHEKAIEIARKALQKGFAIDVVKDITDLDIETIKKLQEEIKK